MPTAVLKPRKARPFFGRHPWVLDSAIDRIDGAPADGDVVDLVTHDRQFIARGIINGQSRIAVRLYSWDAEEPLDESFWRRRLEAAVRLRKDIGYDDPDGAARLVFSEGDGLSGLIVDRYGPYVVVQPTSLAMGVRLPQIVPMLIELLSPRGVMLRTEKGIKQAEGLELRDGPYWGEAPGEPIVIRQDGLSFRVDLAEGHKTGFYLDQRENRQAATRWLRGRRVLDMFCYSGGFALSVAKAGAAEVIGVDGSEKAIAMARANAELNGLGGVRFQPGHCFKTMEAMLVDGERFGAVILDPPKFARNRSGVDEALRAYHWLNRLGVDLLMPGGLLITCSCSGHVLREDFEMMLLGVSQQTGRAIQILEQRGAAPDHPILATCLESEYLKCFICRVT